MPKKAKASNDKDAAKLDEAVIQSLVDNTHDGIVIIGDEFAVEFVNKRSLELLGYKKTDLIGHDFRIDREVILFYTVKDQTILPWQDHLCNRNCEEDCTRILKIVRTDHGLDKPNTHEIRDQFKKTIEEIIEKNKEEKKNE